MRILVLTDQTARFRVLRDALPQHEIALLRTPPTPFGEAGSWSLVIVDADLPDGLAPLLVERLAQARHPVVFAAASPTLPLALEALRLGARDVVGVPPSIARIEELLASSGGVPAKPCDCDDMSGEHAIIGRSPALFDAFLTVARVASTRATLLLRGESGTGKELLARTVHEHSGRATKPFVAVNCAAIPDGLLESELFGYERGAFTGAIARRLGRIERASGGTLFLDEIGDMSLSLQAKLLRVLQEGEIERIGGDAPISIDARVVAATHRDLEAEVAAGRFREDLYYRLAVISIELPPLRARGEDVVLLAEYYLREYSACHGRTAQMLHGDTLAALRAYRWPGNVRQLRNTIERAVLITQGEVVLPCHLPEEIRTAAATERSLLPDELLPLQEMERRHIRRALDATGGHVARAADILGIHRNTLRRKLQESS
jgi:DNA-binding NtrC family response regulator